MKAYIDTINKQISADASLFIAQTDKKIEYQLQNVAQQIFENRNKKPIVLISGPSGSGKTTTALMFEIMLEKMGVVTHTLSTDDYFNTLTDDDLQAIKNGSVDLESPSRLNIDLLNTQLESIEKCEAVRLPKYDFKISKSVDSNTVLKRKSGEIVLVEGIHSLNDSVIKIPDSKIQKIFVNVETTVICGDSELSGEKIRLLRRMIRNNLYRNHSLKDTLLLFDSVKNGEINYIFPYMHRCDYSIDTFLSYELGVYKSLLYSELLKYEDNKLCSELVFFLSSCDKISPDKTGENSLIKEFIG